MTLYQKSESEEFTGDTSTDIHSPDLINDVNLEMQSSEHSAEDTVDAGSAFQSLIVSGKKLTMPISTSPSMGLEMVLNDGF